MKTLKLTDEQFKTLESLLNYEFEQELFYQEGGELDTELLEKYAEILKAMYKAEYNGGGLIDALVYNGLCEEIDKDINDIKALRD